MHEVSSILVDPTIEMSVVAHSLVPVIQQGHNADQSEATHVQEQGHSWKWIFCVFEMSVCQGMMLDLAKKSSESLILTLQTEVCNLLQVLKVRKGESGQMF